MTDINHRELRFFFIGTHLAITLLLALAIFFLFLWGYRQAAREQADELYREILRSKREFIRNAVNRTIQDIEQERRLCTAGHQGPCDERALRERLRERIRAIRLENNGYIWINAVLNYDGGDNYAYRFVHPNLPETEGMMLSTRMQDIRGNFPYLTELEGVKKDGELFFDYWFKKMDSDIIEHKLTFARLYKPYDWIIATGVYLDDIDTLIQSGMDRWKTRISRFIPVVIILTGAAVVLAFLLFLSAGKRVDSRYVFYLNELAEREKTLCRYRDALETKVLERTKALRESESRYRRIVDTAGEGIWELGPDLTTIFVNTRMAGMLGYDAQEMAGRPVTDFMLEEDIADFHRRMADRRAKGGSETYERRYRRKDGRMIHVILSVTPNCDDTHCFIGYFAMLTDITGLKRAAHELAEKEREFRTLAENSPDNIARFDLDCRAVYMNPALEKTLGVAASDLIGLTPEEMPLKDDFREYQEKIAKVLKTGKETHMDIVLSDRGAGAHYQDIRFVAEREADGTLTGVQVIGRDVTEQKLAEREIRNMNRDLEKRVAERTSQLERVNRELEAFAYSVSHDLKAPLRHINGFLELLQKRTAFVPDDRSRHYMTSIFDSVNKMEDLINDLLSFSRMGGKAMSFRPVELGKLVAQVLRDFRPDTAGRDIDWHIGDLPVVEGDLSMLRIVLANLISNALKFTRPRKQARIEIGSVPGEALEIVMFVRDNGVGFDMAYADKLFGVFQRLHRSDEFEGTGIGPANVQRIIIRHGGRTWAEGEPGTGSVFFFSLPQKNQGDTHATL